MSSRQNVANNAADAMKHKQIFNPDILINVPTKALFDSYVSAGILQEGIFYYIKDIKTMYFATSSTTFAPASWTGKKVITVTGAIVAGTIINANLAGVSYSISGSGVNLETSATKFNSNENLFITQNGVMQEKGVDVIWDSSTSFHSAINLDVDDIIIIIF